MKIRYKHSKEIKKQKLIQQKIEKCHLVKNHKRFVYPFFNDEPKFMIQVA